jgi:predicted hotdog family 3-hydroxylacyl-ACP dehydratase
MPYINRTRRSKSSDDSGLGLRSPLNKNDQEKEKTIMAKKTIPPLRVALGYSAVTDLDLAAQALAAHDGVKAHPKPSRRPEPMLGYRRVLG